MKTFFTKNCVALILVLAFSANLSAQDYLTGKLTDPRYGECRILYDRTQNAIGKSIYQTIYKVIDTDKTLLYTVTLTHDGCKQIIYLAFKEENGPSKERILTYDKKNSGLIFSEQGNTDTVFNMDDKYQYLFSFSDADRDYPILHKIAVNDGKQIELDPLTKLRLKKQAEIVRTLPPPVLAVTVSTDPFNTQISQMKDSLYAKSAVYYESIAELRGKIEKDLKHYFGENKIYEKENHYEGETKKGKPEGQGLLVDDGNVYDGLFVKGILNDGNAVLKKDFGEYYGQYGSGAMNGTGWLKYKNGNFWLGIFVNGSLSTGIALDKEANGEMYFGTYKNNQRTGYGELRNPQGDCYYGEFEEGRLVKGYAKEVDQFGYSTYSRIEKGTKKTIEPQEAGEFFDTNLYVKK